MGKKKSVVLMTLITVVLVVLCALSIVPSFSFPWNDGVNGWKSAVGYLQMGADFEGGYYAYYYPEGVISETEYMNNLENYPDDEKADYEKKYVKSNGLYLAKDEQFGIFDDEDKASSANDVSENFKRQIAKLRNVIADRYAKKGYDHYRVSVVDGYALKVEIPASDASYQSTFTSFALTGAIQMKLGETEIAELSGESMKDYIKEFRIGSQYRYNYLEIVFTSEGRDFIKGQKDGLTDSNTQTADSTLNVLVGDEKIFGVYSDSVLSDNSGARVLFVDGADVAQLETVCILMNSALNNEDLTVSFSDVQSEIRKVDNPYGENVKTLVLIALGVSVLLAIALPIVKYGRYGVTCAYGTVTYVVTAALCFAFIGNGVLQFTLGTAAIFLTGLVLMGVFNAKAYDAIKAEFELGKTVNSSVTLGYKKTLLLTVDVYAVLMLGALALLIGAAGVQTMALQALICFGVGAFCNLLWVRVINHIHLSACKNKYQYFRFVREDDDDE